MVKRILIVGGGTAGWLTAGYLAKTLGTAAPGGVEIRLVESNDIGILGVGEGTFPTIRNTLKRIGINEAEMMRECHATFKMGAKFVNWRYSQSQNPNDHYVHSFQSANDPSGLDLLSYWLLGAAGADVNWDAASTPQKIAADAHRAPKLMTHADYTAPLNYAYHFDAVKLAHFLRKKIIAMGVIHIVDTVDAVTLAEDGDIATLTTRGHGELSADLYIDCSGFRAQLIGQALKVPFKSCQSVLFCDTALAMQIPYEHPQVPIASYTIATAHAAGWTWDIGLDSRRGIGYVFSSAHINDSAAEATLRAYVGKAGEKLDVRRLSFEAGYREISWEKNCVAIGLSSGFFEPLEATGIIFVEVAAVMLANLFPWGGNLAVAAKQYNDIMRKRYERTLDFIKLHYAISERRDSSFWLDNIDSTTSTDGLQELLERWRFRAPSSIDIDPNIDFFTEPSWQYVLYGMGYKTDLSPSAATFKYHSDAQMAFKAIKQQADYACINLPSNRELVAALQTRNFGAEKR